MACCAAFMLLAAASVRAEAPPTLATVEACMRANVPPSLQIKQIALQSTDKAGAVRQIKGRLFATREKGLLRAMVKVDAPADLRGASYLLRENNPGEQDAMYVFLPALNKIRRIVGGSQDSPLFGTDISYVDIKQLHQAFGGGSTLLERTENLDGRETYVLRMTPDAAQRSRFSEIRTWVDRQSCVTLRAEFTADGQVRKRFIADAKDLKRSGPYWYVASAVMDDLGAGTRTRLDVEGLTSKDGLSDTYFNPRSFNMSGG